MERFPWYSRFTRLAAWLKAIRNLFMGRARSHWTAQRYPQSGRRTRFLNCRLSLRRLTSSCGIPTATTKPCAQQDNETCPTTGAWERADRANRAGGAANPSLAAAVPQMSEPRELPLV